MSDYTWPSGRDWVPRRFQMMVMANTRTFISPYTQGLQVTDLLADFWAVTLDMVPGNDPIVGGQVEAFFDRLKGASNRIILWNLKRPAPLGTLRGTPTLSAAAAQLANTASIQTTAGATLYAGDMIGIGGQLVRCMADATANGSGVMSVEFAPRLRAAQVSGAAVTWDKPTSTFVLSGNAAPVDWTPGRYTAPSIDLREAF